MKKILVPTDFSDNAHHALNYAVGMAERMKSKIILFNYFSVPLFSGEEQLDPTLIEQLEEESHDNLHLLKIEILERYKKIDMECISSSSLSSEIDEIVSVADENEVDLIVMGTKGASGITKALIGSNTSHVIEKSHAPILAVPQFAEFKMIKKIIYATDFHENDFQSIHFIKEIASRFDAEIIIVHVADEQYSLIHEQNKMDEFIKQLGNNTSIQNMSFKLIAGENIPLRLNNLIKETNADIVSMSTRKRSLYERLFDPSMTKKMLYQTHIPLLTFHLRDGE